MLVLLNTNTKILVTSDATDVVNKVYSFYHYDQIVYRWKKTCGGIPVGPHLADLNPADFSMWSSLFW